MLVYLLMSGIVLGGADSPASAPAFDEGIAGAEIRANIRRLGSYEVEFIRTDEGFRQEEITPEGGFILSLRPQPVLMDEIDTECTWKAGTQGYHYRGVCSKGQTREQKFDGEVSYTLSPGHGIPRWRKKEPKLFLHNLSRLNDDVIVPLDLLFRQEGKVPDFFSSHPESIRRGQYGLRSNTRVLRSAKELMDICGVKTIQVDREYGMWKPPTSGQSDWIFEKQRVVDRWWLDPSHNHLPIRVDIFEPANEAKLVIARSEVLEFKLVGPNTWFPVLGTITVFDVVGKFSSDKDKYERRFENRVPARRTTLKVTNITIGKTFTQDEFKLAPGDKIDETRK